MVLIILVLDDLLLTFLKFKISQVGSPGKQISRRNMKPERELVFNGKIYFDYSSAIPLVTNGRLLFRYE